MAKRWRKPTDAELKREFEAWCEGPGPEEARRHLYEMGFREGAMREHELSVRAAARAAARRAKKGKPG